MDLVGDVKKGIEYLKKLRRGETPQIDRMERSIDTQPSGGGLPPQVPPTPPPEKESILRKRSLMGSAPFTGAEIKKGYRKL